MEKIQINYLNSGGDVIAYYVTDDDFTADEISQWAERLNDSAVDHPGEPEGGFDEFELVEFCPLCPDGHHGQGYSCSR